MKKEIISYILLLSIFIPMLMFKSNAVSTEFQQTIASSSRREYAITDDGSLYSWQKQRFEFSEESTSLKLLMDDVVGVYAGFDNAFAIKSDHSLWEVEKIISGKDGKIIINDLPNKVTDDVKEVAIGFEQCIYKIRWNCMDLEL